MAYLISLDVFDLSNNFFAEEYNDGNPWPIQFVVTTHSSHIANEASFDSMRYFLTQPCEEFPNICITKINDLQTGLSGEPDENRAFLHKYITLTKCDLLFADLAVLIEGPTERLLLPKMIEKIDEGLPEGGKLSSKYLSVIEIGGAHAHIFFNLLNFLGLRTLIITDLDTIDSEGHRRKCKVSEGTHTSNACINNWFAGEGGTNPTINELLGKEDVEKIKNNQRIAYQIPHLDEDACGRSFEAIHFSDRIWKSPGYIHSSKDFIYFLLFMGPCSFSHSSHPQIIQKLRRGLNAGDQQFVSGSCTSHIK